MTNAECIEDFKRRYEDTYVFLKSEQMGNEESLVHVDAVEQCNTHVGVLHLSSIDYGSLRINIASAGHELVFKQPTVGVFQHEHDAIVLTRPAKKQYRRGVASGNVYFNYPTSMCVDMGSVRWTLDTVNNAFMEKSYSFQDALKMLASGRYRSVALADGFSVTLPIGTGEHYYVFNMTHPVAILDLSGKVVKVLEDAHKIAMYLVMTGGKNV